jgi:cytidylate kinase
MDAHPDSNTALADRIHHRTQPVPTEQPIIVTIDGPAGTGKSTVARQLAERLGLDFLDTGAMYRAAAAIVLDRGLDPADEDDVVSIISDADLHFDWTTDPPAVLAWLKPMNERIRERDVTALVSAIAAIAPLRRHMVRKQRIIGHQHPRLVTEGRDQGSVVFPDAAVKFYLDADERVRARRRAEQLREAGKVVDEAVLLQEIRARDLKDSSRTEGPLVIPQGAVMIDTSDLTLTGVVECLEAHVRSRVGIA